MLITDFDAPSGGIQKQSRRLLAGLRERGVRSYVYARNYHGRPRREIEDGTLVYRSPVFSRSLPATNSLSYLAHACAWLVRHRDCYDVIQCQQMFGAAMVGLCARALVRKPVVVRVTSTGELGEVRFIRGTSLSGLRIAQLRRVDRWVALTTDMAAEIQTLRIPSDRIVTIPNAASMPADAAFDPEARYRHRAAIGCKYPQIAVYSGRLSREKGLDTLLNAWSLLRTSHPEAHLLLLGEGGSFRNVEDELRDLSLKLGLADVVHFLGHVRNVNDYLLASDVFVLPTRSEGMSNALVEAMAAGAAIVTTDIPANRDLIADGENGLLVRPDDVRGLAKAVSRLLRAPDLRCHLARAARRKAEAELSMERMTSRYLGLYQELAAA